MCDPVYLHGDDADSLRCRRARAPMAEEHLGFVRRDEAQEDVAHEEDVEGDLDRVLARSNPKT